MNRSNSFVSSLKWWPLQGHINQTNGNTGDGGGGGGGNQHQHHNSPSSHNNTSNHHHGLRGLISFNRTNTHQTFGSSVAVQKLRESKWFKPDEQRIFCAVVECGFIVEVRSSAAVARQVAQQQNRRLRRLQSLTNKVQHSSHSGSSSSSNDSYEHEDIEEFCKHHQASVQMLLSNGCEPHKFNDNEDNGDDDDDDELDLQDENKTPITTWFGVVLCKTGKGKFNLHWFGVIIKNK